MGHSNGTPAETFFGDSNSTYLVPVNQTITELLINNIFFYYTPLLIVLGTIGNLASVFVFYSSKLRLQSTSQYLSALAISDTIFLSVLLPTWLKAMQWSEIFHEKGFCQVFVYVSYVTCSLSAWLVVAFTVERFVAVLYPLQRNAICTVKRARHIILAIAIAALLLNLPLLRFAKPTGNDCSIDYDYMEHAARFNLVDFILTFSAPLTVIILMNTWIMIGVWRLERARQHLMRAERPAPAAGGARGPGARAHQPRLAVCPRSQQRVTRMLLIVSSVFVILNLPAYILRMLAYAYDAKTEDNNERYAALQQLSMMFFNTNFGINFILYCLSGQNFRRALRQSVPWLRRRARRGVAVRRAASCHPARASSVSTSFVSNCTEATTNCPVASSGLAAPPTPAPARRRRRDTFITRWTFDNSRQRQQRAPTPFEQYEMCTFPGPPNI